MNTSSLIKFTLIVSLIIGVTSTLHATENLTTTQMSGESVTLPKKINKVYTFSHSFAILVALAPELLSGAPAKFLEHADAQRYLPAAARQLKPLPQTDNLDLEGVKSQHLDLAIGWDTKGFRREQGAQLARIGLPVLLVQVDKLEQYPTTFRYLGKIFGKAQRGDALASYIEQAATRLQQATASIPQNQRLRVYYAESLDGLTSQCGKADRAEVIWLAGGINALPCQEVEGYQQKPADLESNNVTPGFETLLKLDPDVIITRFAPTAAQITADPRWQRLSAVKQHRVFAIPTQPFNWFDRPPSYMRIMGAQWLASLLYPRQVKIDIAHETRNFYQLFFNVSLDNPALQQLLHPAQPDKGEKS